jgi:hypothetical protein
MNGAELPCGTTLHVEPARATTTMTIDDLTVTTAPHRPPPGPDDAVVDAAATMTNEKAVTAPTTENLVRQSTANSKDTMDSKGDDMDDLDEFFDSL